MTISIPASAPRHPLTGMSAMPVNVVKPWTLPKPASTTSPSASVPPAPKISSTFAPAVEPEPVAPAGAAPGVGVNPGKGPFSDLQPDLGHAAQHLMLLDETAEAFTFQCFTDGEDAPDPDPLAKWRHGTLDDLADWLTAMNRKGAGIFVTVNETDGRGRSKDNIVRARALWQEADRGDEPSLPVEPHIVIESSPGKHHRYILVDDLPLELFEAVQQRMVDDFGSDSNAKDRARVLRLAGFFHLKDPEHPHMVRIIEQSSRLPYAWPELRGHLPPVERVHAGPANLPPYGTPPANLPELRSALAVLNPDSPYLDWLKVGMALHSTGGSLSAFELWDQWSQRGRLYKPGECAYRWASFDLCRDEAVTVKSLFGMAYAQGWQGRTGEEILEDAKALTADSDDKAITALLVEAARLSKVAERRVHEAIKKQTGMPLSVLREAKRDELSGDDEALDHLKLAKDIRTAIGPLNVIGQESGVWLYRHDRGIWKPLEPREERQVVQSHLDAAKANGKIDEVSKGLVDGVTDLFKSEVHMAAHQWDQGHDEAVSTPNGVLILDRGQWVLTPHRREDYRTVQIAVPWDPHADAPRFRQFLAEVFAPDDDGAAKAQAVLEVMGYTLMAHCRHEKFVILVGEGANGKSVLLSVLEAVTGTENTAGVQPSQFDRAFQRAHLHLKLANIVTEVRQGEVIADAELKGIVSGEPSTVERKFQHPFTMRPYATCWFGTNHLPHTRDFSYALFRRALVVRFNRRFVPGVDADPGLKYRLFDELPGILRLALDAYAQAVNHGFTEPPSCIEARDAWRLEADQAAQFISESCGEGGETASRDLFNAYNLWAQMEGIRQMLTHKGFSERLVRLGYNKVHRRYGAMFQNLHLLSTTNSHREGHHRA